MGARGAWPGGRAPSVYNNLERHDLPRAVVRLRLLCPGAGRVPRTLALPAPPAPPCAPVRLPAAMEPLAFPRRSGPAPSAAPALTAELARPLTDGLIKSPKPQMKKQAVKRHHHKHNLRHRYEFLETLGKGTYGKVKKARESSGRLVSVTPSRGAAGRGRRGLQAGWAGGSRAPRWSGQQAARARVVGAGGGDALALRTPALASIRGLSS